MIILQMIKYCISYKDYSPLINTNNQLKIIINETSKNHMIRL